MAEPELSESARLQAAIELLTVRRFRSRIYERIAPGTGVAVRDGTYPILVSLQAGPSNSTAIAASAGIDRTTASRQIAALITAGLVTHRTERSDERTSTVALTAVGQTAAAALSRNTELLIEQALTGWSTQDREAISRLLPRLISALTDAGRDDSEEGHKVHHEDARQHHRGPVHQERH